MQNIKKRTRVICEAAIFVALALALTPLEIKLWIYGGSVDFVMIPLILIALRWGVGWGVSAGMVYGLLNCFIFGEVYGIWQAIFLDYMFAYGACGLAGVFRGKKWGAELGTVLACGGRFLLHLVSGVILWGSYMPEVYFGMPMNNVWLYSALYNGSYMLPNMIIAIVIFAIVKLPLGKYIRAEDLATA